MLPKDLMEQRTNNIDCKDGTLPNQRQGTNQSVGQRPVFALLIGIDDYRNQSLNLKGAIADCCNMKEFLEKNLDTVHIKCLYNDLATRQAIEEAISDLANDGRIENGDPILIYYAGHGAEIVPPRAWNVPQGTSKIQMILPHDFIVKPSPGSVEGQGLFDRTLSDLLAKVSYYKGDNIVVILDSCHSGSGSRQNEPGDTSRIRGVELPEDYALAASLHEDDFDKDGFVGNNGKGRGYRRIPITHVLLAACREEQTARETNRGGLFTTALLETLKKNSFDTITYKDLILRLPEIGQQQNPQCEGLNEDRFFLHKKCMAKQKVFYRLDLIPDNPGTYLLHAGQVNGICDNAEFAVYDTKRDTNLPSIGTLVVHEVSVNTSKLHHQALDKSFEIPKPAFGLETRKGDQERVRIAVSDVGTKETLLAYNLSGVILVNEGEDADLLLIQEASEVKFEILRKNLVDLGLKHTQSRPRPRDIQEVANLLQHAADFHFHLDRSFKATSDSEFRLANHIKIAFVPVTRGGPGTYVSEKVNGKDCDINHEGLVEVFVGDKALYGIKISNEGYLPVYLSLLYFNQSNLRIGSFHNPVTAADGNTPPCLLPNESLKIGYHHLGEQPFRFTFSNPRLQTDVGFLKLFLSTSYLDLSGVKQCSLVDYDIRTRHQLRDIERFDGSAYEPVWDTLTITIIQRRKY